MSARHDRRRLLYTDDSAADASVAVDAEPAERKRASDPGEPYTTAARHARQRRIGELIPTRGWSIAAAIAALVLTVVGLGGLHLFEANRGESHLAAFDLQSQGNIAQWFASMLLGLAALVALYVYSLRQHRADDYSGSYRVWLWMAAVCTVASLCETADVGAAWLAACGKLSTHASLDARILALGLVGIVLGAIGLRLLLEVRRSRWSLATIGLAVGCFALSALVGREDLIPLGESSRPALARGTGMLGFVWIMASFLIYGRHVTKELNGRIKAQKPKKKRKQADSNSKAAKPAADDKPRVETAPAKVGPRLRTDTITSASPAGSNRTADNDSHLLSRAERRKLRREERRAA